MLINPLLRWLVVVGNNTQNPLYIVAIGKRESFYESLGRIIPKPEDNGVVGSSLSAYGGEYFFHLFASNNGGLPSGTGKPQ